MIRPIYDSVLIMPLEDGERLTGGSLVLPADSKWRPRRNMVIAIGGGHARPKCPELIPLVVKVGQIVIVGVGAGQEIIIKGETYRMIREADILAIDDGYTIPEPVKALEAARLPAGVH